MQTETRVHFALCDVTARADCTPKTEDAQPFCNTARDFLREPQDVSMPKYGTLEPQQFLLDGSFALMPDDAPNACFGFWSRQRSDADGVFAAPPKLVLEFSGPHTSAGLTLYFYAPTDEWAAQVRLRWYDAAGNCLAAVSCCPDAAAFFVATKVENYRRVELEFYRTNVPCRCLKLTGVDFGARLCFTGRDLLRANLLEEVSHTAQELSINTLDLVLHDRAGRFHVLETGGYFDALQQKMPFTVQVLARQEDADWQCYERGTFYLSEWANEEEGSVRFHAVDAVGLLDGMPWQGDVVDTTAGQLVARILQGFAYEMAPELAQQPVRGYLPAGTRREALLQLMFAVGGMVQSGRDGVLRLAGLPRADQGALGVRQKFAGTIARLRPAVTALLLTAYRYEPGDEEETLYDAPLQAGAHTVEWEQPVLPQSIAVEGGTLLSAGACSAQVRVDQAAAVRLVGRKYRSNEVTVEYPSPDLPPNTPTRVMQVRDAGLVCYDRAHAVAQRLLAYSRERIELEFSWVALQETPGMQLLVDVPNGTQVRGVVQRMETDLVGGCVARALLAGHSVQEAETTLIGTLYTGERALLE